MIRIKKKKNDDGYVMELEMGDFEVLKMFYKEMCNVALEDNESHSEKDRAAGLEYATKCYRAFVNAESEVDDASEKG